MIARRLLLALTTAAIVVGPLGMTAAHASFGDSVSLTPMRVTAATVPAPANVTGALTCGTSTSNSTMSASWTASTARNVSGYLVTVHFSDGYTQTVPLASTATSWSAPITTYNVTAYQIRYSVTTQTSYGWTAQSARTAWFSC